MPDVLIIGSGIMGAGIARGIREQRPGASILMIDAGPVIGAVAGQHLHDSPEPEVWERYNARVKSGVQALYIGAHDDADVGDVLADVAPGMYHLAAFGAASEQMPGSAISWNVGGMGAHWTAATPWPHGPEVFDFIDPAEWDADLAEARRLLSVDPDPYGGSVAGDAVLERFERVFGTGGADGRHPQAMPMAIASVDGRLLRTGPNRIFPAIATAADAAFELRANTLALRLVVDGARVTGVVVRDTISGAEETLSADTVVVCGDAMRSPQLLWASGIRPPALGRYLNEHAFVTGKVTADLDRLGVTLDDVPRLRDGEWTGGSYWLPQRGDAQPFHGQIMDAPIVDIDLETPIGYSVGVSLYVPTEISADSRLEFSQTELDRAGMPRTTIHYAYSAADLALIERARAAQQQVAELIGDFDPAEDSAVLTAGSSLHYTGTVRMGATDDGTSVCDTDARVWGFSNLYVAGNGVVPTPLTCNSTLTGMITAVRATRAIVAEL